MQKDNGKTLSQLTKQVNQTIDMSDILAGKKPLGGKVGKQLAKAQENELSVAKGKGARTKKFKEFDTYLERMQLIANRGEENGNKIKIERALIADPKNVDKLI